MSDMDQIRDLLDIQNVEHDWTGDMYPPEVRWVTLNGKKWGVVPDSQRHWVSTDQALKDLALDDLTKIDGAKLVHQLRNTSSITFAIDDIAKGLVLVCEAWYQARLVAGLIALHGIPTHSAPSATPGCPALVWKTNGHPRAALMPVKEANGRDLLAEMYVKHYRGGGL